MQQLVEHSVCNICKRQLLLLLHTAYLGLYNTSVHVFSLSTLLIVLCFISLACSLYTFFIPTADSSARIARAGVGEVEPLSSLERPPNSAKFQPPRGVGTTSSLASGNA